MTRLIIATIVLFIVVGVAGWLLYDKEPEVDQELVKKMQLVTKFKDVEPLAQSGNKQAQYQLGGLYEMGEGVSQNNKMAAMWYQKAADQGHGGAQYNLGRMYEAGIGVKQDFFEAFKRYRLAATFGNNRDAYFALGQVYFKGRGVDQDYAKAINYYRDAATRGHAVSQHILGSMYQEGWGVKRDLIMSYIWYTLAAPHVEETVKVNRRYNPVTSLEHLKEKMNRYQIEEAEKRLAKLRQGIRVK